MGGFSSAADEERLTITPPFFSGSTIFVIYKRMGNHVQLDYDSMSGEMCMCECQKLGKERGSEGGRDLAIVLNRKGVAHYYKPAEKQ